MVGGASIMGRGLLVSVLVPDQVYVLVGICMSASSKYSDIDEVLAKINAETQSLTCDHHAGGGN